MTAPSIPLSPPPSPSEARLGARVRVALGLGLGDAPIDTAVGESATRVVVWDATTLSAVAERVGGTVSVRAAESGRTEVTLTTEVAGATVEVVTDWLPDDRVTGAVAAALGRHLAQRGNPTGRPRRSSAASRRRHARRALAQAAGGAA